MKRGAVACCDGGECDARQRGTQQRSEQDHRAPEPHPVCTMPPARPACRPCTGRVGRSGPRKRGPELRAAGDAGGNPRGSPLGPAGTLWRDLGATALPSPPSKSRKPLILRVPTPVRLCRCPRHTGRPVLPGTDGRRLARRRARLLVAASR